jgi:hypothetical protein
MLWKIDVKIGARGLRCVGELYEHALASPPQLVSAGDDAVTESGANDARHRPEAVVPIVVRFSSDDQPNVATGSGFGPAQSFTDFSVKGSTVSQGPQISEPANLVTVPGSPRVRGMALEEDCGASAHTGGNGDWRVDGAQRSVVVSPRITRMGTWDVHTVGFAASSVSDTCRPRAPPVASLPLWPCQDWIRMESRITGGAPGRSAFAMEENDHE